MGLLTNSREGSRHADTANKALIASQDSQQIKELNEGISEVLSKKEGNDDGQTNQDPLESHRSLDKADSVEDKIEKFDGENKDDEDEDYFKAEKIEMKDEQDDDEKSEKISVKKL